MLRTVRESRTIADSITTLALATARHVPRARPLRLITSAGRECGAVELVSQHGWRSACGLERRDACGGGLLVIMAPPDRRETLRGSQRIVVIGRTGSGKTTLARELSAALEMPHVELDALYFGPDFSTAPLPLLRERTLTALAGHRWVTDGNKSALRDLVWPRADTVIWLDYPVAVSLWRLGKRALWRTSVLKEQVAEGDGRARLPALVVAAAKGVLKALRSHAGQRRRYPRLFAEPQNRHLSIVRLRSPRATRAWMARVAATP